MYYLCSENKGADQLRGYREADQRLCFRICKKPVFSQFSLIFGQVYKLINVLGRTAVTSESGHIRQLNCIRPNKTRKFYVPKLDWDMFLLSSLQPSGLQISYILLLCRALLNAEKVGRKIKAF